MTGTARLLPMVTAGTVADQRLAPEVEASYERLKAICRGLGSTLVAFSAGVDSTLLLRVCADELGQRAVAVTAVSESYPPTSWPRPGAWRGTSGPA